MGKNDSGMDFAALADSIDELKEILRSMINSLITDGFTEAQARIIVTGILGRVPNQNNEENS